MRPVLHLVLHGLVPLGVAWAFWRPRFLAAAGVMLATWLVDLDHLLAVPTYDPNRCSLGFHPLHTAPAIVLYLALALFPKTRLVGLGLVIHMVLDGVDCAWMMWG